MSYSEDETCSQEMRFETLFDPVCRSDEFPVANHVGGENFPPRFVSLSPDLLSRLRSVSPPFPLLSIHKPLSLSLCQYERRPVSCTDHKLRPDYGRSGTKRRLLQRKCHPSLNLPYIHAPLWVVRASLASATTRTSYRLNIVYGVISTSTLLSD